MKAVVFMITLSVVIFASLSQAEVPKIRLGVSSALTGNAAPYGTDIKNALIFANDELTDSKYEFIFEDDKCSGRDAVTVAHKLIKIDRVNYVLGFACSSTLLSSGPLYQKAKVLAISSSAAAPAISKLGDFVYRTWPSDVETARVLYRHVADGHRVFGIMSEATDYAQGLEEAFVAANSDQRLTFVNESYLTDDMDYRSALLKLKSRNIDGLFLNSQTERTLANLVKQVRELEINIPLYGAYFPGSQAFLELAKERANGITFVDLPSASDLLDKEGQSVYQRFVKQFGPPKSWDTLVLTTIESFRVLHEAIEAGGDARQYLQGKNFNGLVGQYSFDANGDIVGLSPVIKVVKNGRGVNL